MSIAHEKPTPAPAVDDRVWSPVELLHKVENDIDLATELIEIFLEDAPEMSYDISMAVRAGNPEHLAHAAHAYRGSAVAIGANALGTAAGALEAAGRAGHAGVDLELAYFKELEQRVIAELAAARIDS